MPVEDSKNQVKVFNTELLKALKGKSCFHIRKNDPPTLESIRDALKAGYDIYKQNGWT
jgi:hypothetical protein